MKNETTIDYIKNVESRMNPAKIATVYQGAEYLKKLPLFMQKRIINKSSKKEPYMGFVVEPYSLFLAYEIDKETAKDYIPENYELVPISLFDDSEKKNCAIIGCFNVKTSVFWGTRFELYIIARNKKTKLISWLICDYESDTIHYDPGKGFLSPTLKKSAYTTSFNGEIICNFVSNKSKNEIDIVADIKEFSCIELNKKLWIEGNLSIDYSGELDNSGDNPFGLIFDPGEMRCAQLVKPEKVTTHKTEFGFIDSSMKPFEICCFQYAQHYITTVFPRGHEMKNENDLENKITEILKSSSV